MNESTTEERTEWMIECEHLTSDVLSYAPPYEVCQCTWGCGKLFVNVHDPIANGLREWMIEATLALMNGADLMSITQLGQWPGVRGLIETAPLTDEENAELMKRYKANATNRATNPGYHGTSR